MDFPKIFLIATSIFVIVNSGPAINKQQERWPTELPRSRARRYAHYLKRMTTSKPVPEFQPVEVSNMPGSGMPMPGGMSNMPMMGGGMPMAGGMPSMGPTGMGGMNPFGMPGMMPNPYAMGGMMPNPYAMGGMLPPYGMGGMMSHQMPVGRMPPQAQKDEPETEESFSIGFELGGVRGDPPEPAEASIGDILKSISGVVTAGRTGVAPD